MGQLLRGQIYRINFPYTFDKKYPNGKYKYAVVLQSGERFNKRNTVMILLTTSNSKGSKYSNTDVFVSKGLHGLSEDTYICCSQIYTVDKSLFSPNKKAKYIGRLSEIIMIDIDAAMYDSLCIGYYEKDEDLYKKEIALGGDQAAAVK